MAYIVNTTLTPETTASASFTVTLGSHTDDDLVLVLLANDGGGTTIAPDAAAVTAGWAMIGTQASANASRSVWAYKIVGAGEAPVTAPTFTGANDEWTATCLVVRDAHAAPFGSLSSGTDFVRSDAASVTFKDSGSLTTAVDDCLLIYSWNIDNANIYGRCKVGAIQALSKTIGNANHIVGCYQQKTAGAAPTVRAYFASGSTGGNSWVLAIRNKANGTLNPDVRVTADEISWHGSFANSLQTITWQAPNSFAASINGITCSSTAPSINNGQSFSQSTWGNGTNMSSSESTASSWVGGTFAINSVDMSQSVIGVLWGRDATSAGDITVGSEGVLLGISDGTNWAVYQMRSRSEGWTSADAFSYFASPSTTTPYASSGAINLTAVTRIGYFAHRIGSSTSQRGFRVKDLVSFISTKICGGGANYPANFSDYTRALNSWGNPGWANLQGTAQALAKFSVQIGDDTASAVPTYFDSSASAFEFPQQYSASQLEWEVPNSSLAFKIKALSGDTINLTAGVMATDTVQAMVIDSTSSTGATYSFNGMSFVGWLPTWKTGVNPSGATFSECGEIDAKGSDWTDCTIKKTTSTDAAIAFSEDGGSMTRCTIDVTGTSAAYHLELGTTVTAITLADVTFTGTPGTDKVHVKKTTGTVTITTSGTTSLVSSDVTSDGATVSIVAPALERGLEFTGLLAGSQVKVFSTGTDTEQFSTNNSGTTETWDDATAGSLIVDYVIQKAGYLPIRVTGITVTGAVGTGVQSVPVSQVIARWYQASSGLTINTNAFANATTKKFGLTVTSTLQNFASYLMEQWIALGDSGEAYANKAFPIEANGPNSFTWLYDWEADLTTYPNTISNLSRDGMRYLSTSGTRTASWAALLSAGVSAGMQVRYQQSDGGTTNNAAATGNIDQLIQIYGDALHGNFDRTGYMVAKVQEMGYDQVEVDVISQYGTLEDQLYVIALAPTANGIATGNPALANPPTITDHGATPVTWNAKDFSITIIDSAAGNTGIGIIRWLRYNFETGGTFQGKDGFNWHDLVQTNGEDFKTVRGIIYGDTGATLKGVRVVQSDGTTPHPDFTLFTADDGTTYIPPPSATVTINNITSGSRVQLYDTINNVELYNAVVGATSLNYSETYTVDRTVRVRITYVNGTTAKQFIEAVVGTFTSSSPNISYNASQEDDDTYNSNAVDGSTIIGITFTDAATDLVNIDIAGGTVPWKNIYAAFVYWIDTALGIADDIAYIEAVDPANYLLTSMKIKNTSSPSVPLTITGGYARDSSTGSIVDIIDTTGGNIYPLVDHVVSSVVTVGGTNIITGDIADVPTATEIKDAIVAAAETLTVGKFLGLK